MRKWYVPLTLMGLGSLGLFLLTDRGRQAARWLNDRLRDPDALAGWNDAAQGELERIQAALDRVAVALEGKHAQQRTA
jgi:predicted LPLAT superfamily acyltransferase